MNWLWIHLRPPFNSAGFMPHGHCYLWDPGLVWTHVTSDATIGIAYVFIAFMLWGLARNIRLTFSPILLAFGAFILACGLTHFLEIWTLWTPSYWLSGAVKVVTAGASIATAIALIPLRPRLVRLAEAAALSETRREQLEEKNQLLEALNSRQAAEASRKLRDSEEHFRALMDNLPEIAWSAQADGRVDFYNRGWYAYTGTTFEEMQGWGWQSVQDVALLPRVLETWKRSLSTGEPFEMEFPIRGANGDFRWFLTRVRPLKNSAEQIVRWFGINTDVEEKRKASALLETAIETRDTFLSVASHELKTPLTPMALRLQVLERATDEQPDSDYTRQVRTYTDTARRQIGKLTSLVNDLLDVSRISTGQFRMEMEDVDLASLVRDVMSRFEVESEKFSAPVALDAPAALNLCTSRLRMEQVVTNLVDNALKYGAGKPVELRLRQEGNQAILTVTDHGIGIEKPYLKRIFERFERAVSDRHYGGLGLGLYITRTIVETLGGSVAVESEIGKGATFTVKVGLQPPS